MVESCPWSCLRVPPSPLTDRQLYENITFLQPSDAGGNKQDFNLEPNSVRLLLFAGVGGQVFVITGVWLCL